MDLKKRIEKLEKARSAADERAPGASQQFEVRELTIEEWNERYVKPYEESLRRKREGATGFDEVNSG
jgi:transposase-like protein